MAEENNIGLEDTHHHEGLYFRKYFALRRRCEQVQLQNERLVSRLQHVKEMIRKYKKQRKILMTKLEDHGDNFREAMVPYMHEESRLLGIVTSPPPASTPGLVLPSGDAIKDEAGLLSQVLQLGGAHSAVPGGSTSPFISPATSTENVSQAPAVTTITTPSGKAKKVKAEKPEKDPNAPKKPANAFFMFCQQQRPLVQEEHFKENKEEMTHQELTKKMALEWNALPQEKKKVYYDMYEVEKSRYEEEMRHYSGSKEVKPTTSVSSSSESLPSLPPDGASSHTVIKQEGPP